MHCSNNSFHIIFMCYWAGVHIGCSYLPDQYNPSHVILMHLYRGVSLVIVSTCCSGRDFCQTNKVKDLFTIRYLVNCTSAVNGIWCFSCFTNVHKSIITRIKILPAGITLQQKDKFPIKESSSFFVQLFFLVIQ